MDVSRLQEHIASLKQRIAEVQTQIQQNTNAAVTRRDAGNMNGAKQYIRIRKLKRDRLALLEAQLVEAMDQLAELQPQAAALPNNLQGIFNNIDRIAAASARSLLPEMSEAEFDEEMRRAQHAQYLANMARGAANAASANAASVPVPTSSWISFNPFAPGASLPPSTLNALQRRTNAAEAPQPGMPVQSPYPIRIGGKSRRLRRRSGKSRRRKHKTTLRRRR